MGAAPATWSTSLFTPGPDVTPPTVVDTDPEPATTNVNTASPVTATMSEPIQSSMRDGDADRTLGTRRRNRHLLVDHALPGHHPIDDRWPRPPPTPRLVSGALDLAGNAMVAPDSWTFTTAGVGACTCTLFSSTQTPVTADSNDPSAVELGVRFSLGHRRLGSPASGSSSRRPTPGCTPAACGPASGTLLATGTFTGETASGWQTLEFATPGRR